MSTRLNQITFFTGMVILVFSGVNLVIGQYFQKGEASVNFNVKQIKKLVYNQVRQWDECWINFEISADLKNYFTWNSKMAYVYVNVVFQDKEGKYKSENIIWDQHIKRQQIQSIFDTYLQKYYTNVNYPNNSIKIDNQKHEYALRDVHKSLFGQTVTFEVWAEITPIIGNIYREKIFSTNYTLPNKEIR